MQDRYVGDVGDFGKYGLLRSLTRTSMHARLGVVWYLSRPESNGDGKHLSYLNKAQEYRQHDPELFDSLGDILRLNRRSVAEIKASGLLGDAIFIDEIVSPPLDLCDLKSVALTRARKAHRETWSARALAATSGCDLVFLDPDNGIGGRSFHPFRSKGHKHASWEEVRQFADAGARTLVVYHHAGRNGSAEEQARALKERFRKEVPEARDCAVVALRRGTHRMFLVAPAVGRENAVRHALIDFASTWGAHCSVA